MKVCKRCGLGMSVDEFYIDRSSRDGRNDWCKSCVKQYKKECRIGLHICIREQNFNSTEYHRRYYREITLQKRRETGVKPRRSLSPSDEIRDAVDNLINNFVWDDLAIRFWSYVRINPNGCWEWDGARTKHGYGRTNICGKSIYAHRAAYEMAYGSLGSLFACHQCDNPRCVNPTHIYAGTPQDNAADRERRGRGRGKSK